MSNVSADKVQFWNVPVLRQCLVVSGAMSLMFAVGVGFGTATVMLPQLRKNEEILVSDTMASWIYSSHGFGSVPAVLIVPGLAQWKGYKFTFLLISVPIFSSFVLQYFAASATHLLIVTILQGATMGGNLTLGVIAITEYAEPRLRSMFLVMKSASYFWGIWIANMLGTFFNWKYIPLLGFLPVLFSLSTSLAWIDGPYWLASKGRMEECKNSFRWLRGPHKDAEELESIIKNQRKTDDFPRNERLLTRIRKTVALRQFYMPFFVNCASFSMYYLNGKIVLAVYALDIIKDITKNESTAYAGMLIMDAITVIGMYIGSYIAMKVKRRSMYLSTSAVSIVFLYVLCAYLSLVNCRVITQNSILFLSLLVIYCFSVSWGPMVLGTAFVSEITPMRFKYFIISVGSVFFYCLHVLTLKTAPIMFKSIGIHFSFGVYGTLTLICWIYLYKYLPETRNKTLQELEMHFVKDKKIFTEIEKEIMIKSVGITDINAD